MNKFLKEIYTPLKRWHILGWQQFKERKQAQLERKEYLKLIGDWYYQHSWFERKWFLHKLKRIIMEVLLDIWRKIGNKILFSYYTEVNIIDKYNFYMMSFPLVIKNENQNQARQLIKTICDDLEKDFGFRRVDFSNPEQVLNEKIIKNKIDNFYKGTNPRMIGEIEFNIYHGKNIKPQNIEFITDDKNLINGLGTYKYIDTQTINYKTINRLDNYLPPLEKFVVKIMLTDIEVPLLNLTKEEQEERMQYLLNYKPKK